ncbi:glycosyltransferase family 2 protein [Piscirickettsia litoralis]|uniref:Glycosyltransferase 2-like domain-containing protein n=1 Tax=Piscirickettsia litoralis TaxID=1891921 RepID=A0ABX3A1B0_9GAMM|nr:glycosyltransferase family 2 protein [Piscirickettsia litoralis]ODN42656.1 hypothetical protein BGC07_06630 [Piscirickettsia litoralis]
MASLSVIVITKNEAHDIGACIDSVSWADEIIVLDSGSTDGTQDICREKNVQLYETDWPGFGKQKQRALAKASCDWVLSLDADERVSPELRKVIEKMLAQPKESLLHGYEIRRENYFCGYRIKHQKLWANNFITRLVQNGKAYFDDLPIHENLHIAEGEKLGLIKESLIHYSYRDYEEALAKMNSYTTVEASERVYKYKKINLKSACFHSFWSFMRNYFFKKGFLDGRAGFFLCCYMAQVTYSRHIKMMLLKNNKQD